MPDEVTASSETPSPPSQTLRYPGFVNLL